MVYSGFNFFLAMPIICVGVFDKDVTSQTAEECHKLYAVGRLGIDLNLKASKTISVLIVAIIASVVYFS